MLRSKAIVEPKSEPQKINFWGRTTHKRGILSRFPDKRPNRSHLRGVPETKMAWGPALPKSVPAPCCEILATGLILQLH